MAVTYASYDNCFHLFEHVMSTSAQALRMHARILYFMVYGYIFAVPQRTPGNVQS